RALDDRQLWRVDSISGNVGVIANRLNGRVLGINTAGQLVAQYPDGSASQQWQMIDGLGFSNVATQQIFSLGANNAITLAPMPSPWPPPQGSPPPAPSLLWGAMAYLSTPDLSTNELDHFVGQFFHLDSMLQDVAPSALAITRGADRSLSLAQCQMSGTPSRTQAFTAARDLVLNYDDTGTEYALAVVQNGSTNMVTLLPTAAGLSPAQQAMAAWILNTDGLFIHSQTGLLLTGNATTGLSLTPYDALFPASQNWQPMFVQGGSTSAHRLLSQTSLGDTPHPQLVVTKLVVDIELGNDLLDGTDHKVTMSFNGADYQDVNYQGFWTGYHWFRGKTFTIDCSAWDQVRNLVFEDLQQLFLKIDQGSWWTPDDSCYIENITLTVNDVYRVKRHTGFWLKSSQSIFIKQHEWGEIDPANPSQPGKPFDWSGKVYPVGLIPWIGDIRSWRTYDSSTIDGVGILLGVRNGQLVGNQMKAGMCEILGPNTPGNSYTWVFAPNGAIIYKKWDHTVDKTQYTRHSQLNYGNPVICAGEFLLKSGGGGQPWAVVPDTFIAEVNDASGHYKPEGGDCLRYVQDQLTALGVDTTNVEWRWREG
ncbi:MAG: RICIN domain-containing protein, partial [Pyrinomonadaceae bacterium]